VLSLLASEAAVCRADDSLSSALSASIAYRN
jgi:hypothetical protein